MACRVSKATALGLSLAVPYTRRADGTPKYPVLVSFEQFSLPVLEVLMATAALPGAALSRHHHITLATGDAQ